MLKDPHNSVTKVSIELGFSDLSYFTKVFKRYTGMTPRTYLKQQQQLPAEHRAELSVPQPPPQVLDVVPRASRSPKNKAASPPQKRYGQSKRLVS